MASRSSNIDFIGSNTTACLMSTHKQSLQLYLLGCFGLEAPVVDEATSAVLGRSMGAVELLNVPSSNTCKDCLTPT